MDTELAYQAFLIKLPNMTEEELYYYIQNASSTIEKEHLFSLCFHCRKVNYPLFPIFYISLTRMFPLSSLKIHINNLTWLSEFQWSDYLDILTVLSERELLTEECNTIYDQLFYTIIHIIADQLYTERYYVLTVSTLGLHLPREKKNLDKRTKIVKKLAYAYYRIYLERNKPDDEDWEDVDRELNIKNKAMKLYRKDVSNLSRRAREQKASDHFSL